MNAMERIFPEPGMLVFSTAGRDFGSPYLIISIVDERFVFVADGEIRKLGRPKRKNIRHLSLTGLTEENISVKLKEGFFSSDAELRRAIDGLVSSQKNEQRS